MPVLDLFSLEGKSALVTGGAGLYGRQIVRAIAEAGAETCIASRNIEALEMFAGELRRDGLPVTAMQYDQGDDASILMLRDAFLGRHGKIDVLVNNAVARPMKDGFYSAAETFDESMRVNATGLFIITRAFGDSMAEAGSGSIINIGSIQGMIGPDPPIYRGTTMHAWAPDYFFHKGGMINFTRFIASYYGPRGVRCNCLSPGGFQTPEHPEPFVRQYSERTFLGRLANDTDLMGAVVFLASDAARYVTGINLPVDGGYTAK
ncbi:MAG TPA: SDR family oxidoreductase [Candidatus Bathyarchaeia archaeon]|nr:SDR family oxidoreductase [Candidatus Bathyarchaeia archaeon]